MKTIIIDGSQGEGGGQILRTSLTLAMCLDKKIQVENIRAGRKKPGILRQHLACLKAAKNICDAQIDGGEIGAERISFCPGKIKSGVYRFSVGTAGSTTLIMQTILLPLLMADGISEVTFEGGTHNPMAPTFDFLKQSFLPRIIDMGCSLDIDIENHGFYPAGGGLWQAKIRPADKFRRLELCKVAEPGSLKAVAISSKIPRHVGERELAQAQKKCGLSDDQLRQVMLDSIGPGNVLSLRYTTKEYTAIFEAFGERNVSAEKVADRAIGALQKYQRAQVPVCTHLADQLIVPLALGSGGTFVTQEPSEHLLTNIRVVKQIMGVDISVCQVEDKAWRVEVL